MLKRTEVSVEKRARSVVGLLVCLPCFVVGPAQSAETRSTEHVETRRLLGKAYYENGDFAAAAREYRRAAELAPGSAADQFNLGLVLLRGNDPKAALQTLEKAEELDPELLNVHYVRGILHRRQLEMDQAIKRLEHVVARDPQCSGCFYNLGVCYKLAKDYDKAIAAFSKAVALAPEHPSSHYQLMTLYRRTSKMDDAKRHEEIYERIKDTIDESEKTPEALERSKYSDLVQASLRGRDPTPRAVPEIRFVDITAEAGLTASCASESLAPVPDTLSRSSYSESDARRRYVPSVGGAVALGDYDGDGDLDLYAVRCSSNAEAAANRLWRNEGGGRFTDVTPAAGVGDAGMGLDATFGDFDNDGKVDLYVVNCGRNVLYHNRGDGTFEDVSRRAGVDEPQFGRKAVFVDYDHDHDLDIFVANDVDLADPPDTESFRLPEDFSGQTNTMMRNNGNRTFVDQTDESGLLVDFSQSRDLLFADFDGDADIDLFVANFNAPSLLFTNLRLGRFAPGGAFDPPLDEGARAAAEVDLNRDGAADLLVAVKNSFYGYVNDGHASFKGTAIPLPDTLSSLGAGIVEVFESNNDGRADVLLVDPAGERVSLLAGIGPGRFRDLSAVSGLDKVTGSIAGVATGDLDGDGDADIVLQTRDRGPVLLRNEGGNKQHWLTVKLVGKKVNRSGYGAAVEIAAGNHYQRQTARAGWIHFGLGNLESVDIVRVTWPTGIAQNVIRPGVNARLEIEEHVRVSVSCAFLWADGGTGWQLVNEILGVGALGVPVAPGVHHRPDCTELTKIEHHQLRARDGMYDLRLTEELREIMFADRFTLRVVDHPENLEIVPNEMFTAPPFPEDKFYAVGERRPPRRAVDHRGRDVLDLLLHRDGRFPTFPLTEYDGLAHPHSISLDLGDLSGARQIVLYLDGWIYWPDSSTVLAIAQDPGYEVTPLVLEVRDVRGEWRTAIESVGLPTSKGLVVPVDLSGVFSGNDYRVRLSTTMCVYFDRIFVSTEDESHRAKVTELPVLQAALRYRGFSKMMRDPLGFERFDYETVSQFGAWDPPTGLLTRYGDVTELLAEEDDRYVIFGPGDELRLRFGAGSLPDLRDGWLRTFIFYANGWVKDGDLGTTHSGTVAPLPFRGMSGYPYPASEAYPRTPAHRQYLETYNTRPAGSTVGRLAPARERAK